MKKTVFLAGAFATMFLASACKKQGCTDPTALNYSQQAEVDNGTCAYEQIENALPLTITSDLTLTNDKIWRLVGRTTVTAGTTLSIEPGTIIKGLSGTGANASCLIIARGAMINAQGTADAPIIFTAEIDDVQPGDIHGQALEPTLNGLWGGLIILGNAPISADAESVQIEGIPASDNNGLYGGTDANDNSGILSYVSIRHGGANIGEGNEINGLTLGGVGAGTTINNIEVVANQDDGIEFFGGNVNCQDLLVWNVGDDAIDIDQGYGGDINGVMVIPGLNTDHAFEIDGGEGSWNAPFTIERSEVIADTAQAHIRAGATGFLYYYGNVNFEHDPGTSVTTFQDPLPIDQSPWSWTWYKNR